MNRMRLLQVLTVFVVVAVVVEGKGKGGAKGNKQQSQTENEEVVKDPWSDCRSSIEAEQITAKERILSFMTVEEGSWALANATNPDTRRYTLAMASYDYCMACEGLSVADPICKTVCYQTSDCYTLLYTTSEGDLLVNKGCLYDPDDGKVGCDIKKAECLANNMTQCSCDLCKGEYCNWDSSSFGLKLNSLLIVAVVYFFVL